MSKKQGGPRASVPMTRTRIPTPIADEIHKQAVLAGYKKDWQFIEAKCLKNK